MSLLLAGLVLFLGSHSVRILADDWRARRIAALGSNGWKGIYSLVAVAGFVMIVYGYAEARQAPVVPGTRIKRAVGHPMVLAVKIWALAHLIANGTLADALLFGSFLAWAVLDYMAARRRDRAAGTVYVAGPLWRDALAVIIGVVAWFAFALWLHRILIGVAPFG
jgi:hypothetical protein